MLPLTTDPGFSSTGATGTRARGYAYERAVGRYLARWADELGWTFYDHPWLVGRCQPDFVLESSSGCLIVVEAKLTECDCTAQLAKYKRVLGGEAVGFQIARRVVSVPTMSCLDDAFDGGLMLLWI